MLKGRGEHKNVNSSFKENIKKFLVYTHMISNQNEVKKDKKIRKKICKKIGKKALNALCDKICDSI